MTRWYIVATLVVGRRSFPASFRSPETVVLGLRLAGTRHLLGVDEMSRSPITLNESPRSRHVHGVPAVTESIVLEADARLVTRGFAVPLDDHAVQAGVTVTMRMNDDLDPSVDFRETNRRDRSVEVKRSRISILKRN